MYGAFAKTRTEVLFLEHRDTEKRNWGSSAFESTKHMEKQRTQNIIGT